MINNIYKDNYMKKSKKKVRKGKENGLLLL